MATTLLENLEHFDPDSDQYVEQLEQMFVANDLIGEVKVENRRSILLSVVGKRTYDILRHLNGLPPRPWMS